MIIEIKNKMLQDPVWTVNKNTATLTLDTDESFPELLEEYGLSEGDVINQYSDDGAQIGQFTVISMGAIETPQNEIDQAIIRYNIALIGKNAQEAIEKNMSETDDAILEIASMISEIESENKLIMQNFTQEQERVLNDFGKEREAELKDFIQEQKTFQSRVESDLSTENERINSIQNSINAHNQMFEQIQKLVNTFADRIAVIENRLNGG